MKRRKLFLLSIFLLLSLGSQCQISLGIKGGYSKVWEDYGDIEIPDGAIIHLNRFNIALTAYKQINKFLSIGIEPGYAQRGAACVPGTIFFDDDSKFFFDYLSIPLFASGHLNLLDNKLGLFGKVGYGVSRFVYGESEIPGGVGFPEFVRFQVGPGWNNINGWEHGTYLGGGIQIAVWKGFIRFESEYYLSFNNAVWSFNSKNRSLSANLGYMIQFR